MTGAALLNFFIGLIILCVVVFLIYKAIDFLAPPEFAAMARYVVGALALIALLLLAGNVLFGVGPGLRIVGSNQRTSQYPAIGAIIPPPPSIIQGEYRG